MKKNSLGISLISLIITVIVIIILAAIVIFTGLGTPDSANFAKFASEFSDFNLAVDNAYMKEFQDNSLENKQRSKAQVYYKIATGTDVGMNGTPVAVGKVDDLGLDIKPGSLNGTEYYEITSDKNVHNWNKEKQYFNENEKHYVTDEGDAFFLPGYLVIEDDGTNKWYINEKLYYTGEGVAVAALEENSAANLLEVGDYVNYVPDNASYTPDATKLGYTNGALTTASATWRVWNVNKVTGEVLISTEMEVNPFKAKLFFTAENQATEEVDNICEKLYSNQTLGIKGKRLTIEDVNKAFDYTPEWQFSRTAYYVEDEEIEEGIKVVYEGEEYTTKKDNFIFYDTDGENYYVEGGEETTGINGLKGITAVKGKPLYMVEKNYNYNPNDYNSALAETIKDDPNIQGETWLKNMTQLYTSRVISNNRYYSEVYIPIGYLNSSNIYAVRTKVLGKWNINSYPEYSSSCDFHIRPAVVLNAKTLIDTSDSTRDGKSAATAWNFKY